MPFNKFRRRDLTTKVPEQRSDPLPWSIPVSTDTPAYPHQSSFSFSPNLGYPSSSSVPPVWPNTYYSAFCSPGFASSQSNTFLNTVPAPIVRGAASAHELSYLSSATMAPLIPGAANLGTRQSVPPIGVFWDIENCQVPKGRSALVAIQRIREQFVSKYLEAEFVCVCDIRKEPPQVIQELNDAQISVVHVAGNSKNAADDKLRQSMRRFADIHTSIAPQQDALPATILLISGDINFATDLYDLRYRKRLYVILLHNKQAPQSLLICANEHFDFYSILGDLPNRPTREDFDDEKDIPSKGGHNPMDVVVSELPPMKNVNKIKMRLKKLSDNCGGKVMNVQGQFAVLRFPNKEAAARASKRMNGEDVFGSKIRVLYSSQIEISQTQTQQQSSTMIATQVMQPTLTLASSSQPGPSSNQHQMSSMPMMRNGSGSPGSGGSYQNLQQRKKPVWKRASGSSEQEPVVDYQTLKKEVAALLQDVPNHSLPLFKFREMFERRYRRSVSSYDLYRMRDVVNISESSAMSSSSSGSNSPCSGRNISLNQDWIFKEDDLIFFCKQHPPKNSGIAKMRTGWAEKEVTPSMPIVIIELKTLATRVHTLLHSHEGDVPVLSFLDCYESAFGPMEVSNNGHGVPLEHLLTCIQGVEIGFGENGLKRLQWSEKRELESQNGFNQPQAQALQMAQLSRELIDLLRTFPRCCLAFAKLIPAYHHHFGRQCRVADYNHATLSSLLKTLPQTIQVMGENQNRILTLAHKAQMKRFATDVLRILKAQGGPAKQVKLEDFGHHYLQVFPNRAFNPEDYGLCFLQDLVSELVENSSLVALVTDDDGTAVLAIPKREQSPLEIHKTRIFATEVFDLLRHSIRCEMPFSKFIPAYHHHFGRQCRVADYGFSKLAELFEAITDTVIAVNPRNIAPHQECSMDDKILRLTPKEQVKVIGEQLWYMVEMRQKAGLATTLDDLEELFLKQYGFALRPELCEAESVIDLVINKLSHLLKVDSNNYLILMDRAQQEQLVYSAKSILEAQSDCTMRLDDFVNELKKHCKDADLQLIQTDLGHLTIISQDDHEVETIMYAPFKAFGREITELLEEVGGHVLLVNFENAYFNKFGRQIRPGHFGCSTLSDLLNGFPEIITIRGTTRSKRTIVLNSRSGAYERRPFVNKTKQYNLAPVPSNNYNGKSNGSYQSDTGSRSPKWRGINNATVVTPPLYGSAPPSPMYATRGPTEGTAFTYDRIPQLSPPGYDMWVRDGAGCGPPASVSPPVVWAYHPVVYPGPAGSPAASPNMMLPPQLSFGSSPWSPPPTPVMVFEPPRMAANPVGLGIGLDQNGTGAMYLTNQNHLAQSFHRVKISSED